MLGLGLGLSGVIDSSRGVCQFSHLLQWENVALGEPLQRRLRLPVWVDNDVKTLAVAEKWVGEGADARDFITLSVGRGVGLGIVIDRALYRGASGGAGELGHVVVDPSGPTCECGRRGCLEAFVGERALCRRVGARLGRDVAWNEMLELARGDDAGTVEVLADAGRTLGMALANVVTLLNPELLIVCGEGTELGPAFFDPLTAAVHEGTFAGLGRALDIRIQQWGNDKWAVGAATLVVRELVQPSGPRGPGPRDLAPARRAVTEGPYVGADAASGAVPRRPEGVRTTLAPSVDAMLRNQRDSGAFVASPDFAQYQYCWLRDASFVAYALDAVGEHRASARYHAWVGRAIEGIGAAIDAAVSRHRSGKAVDPGDMPPARFGLDGSSVVDDWPNFQIDGYGTWLWALHQHLGGAERAVLPDGLRPAVERVGELPRGLRS